MPVFKMFGTGAALLLLSLLAGCTSEEAPSVKPGAVYAIPGNRQITVYWNPPADKMGGDLLGYTVLFSSTETTACSTTGGAYDTSCVVPNLTNGTPYTFFVIANFTNDRRSKPSNGIATATPVGTDRTPNNPLALAGDGKVLVSWSMPFVTPTNDSSTVFSYSAQAVGTSAGCVTTRLDSSCIVTGLTNGRAYTFVVTATYVNRDTATSLPSLAVTPTAGFGVPGQPQGLTTVFGDSKITVSWVMGTNTSGSPVTKYRVNSSSPFVNFECAASPCTVTGLDNGYRYALTVTAYNGWGAGPASAPSDSTIPATLPGQPNGVTASPGNGQAAVIWSQPSYYSGYPITSYTVKSSPGNFTCTAIPPSSGFPGCTVTGLTNGTAYTFTVTATTQLGTGPASSPSPAVTPTAVATWTARTSGVTGSLHSAVWTGSQYVATGSSGNGSPVVITSADGVTWNAPIIVGVAYQFLAAVAWTGAKAVIVGSSGAVFTSPDAVTWTARTSGTANELNSVVWTSSQLVAVGDSGTILTSPDGVTWTARTSGTTKELRSVAWTGAQLVAVGLSGTVLTSPDGVAWTTQTAPNLVLNSIAWSGSRLVAVSNYSTPLQTNGMTSTDGVTWTLIPACGTHTLSAVGWDGNRFLYVGDFGAIFASPDGIAAGTAIQPSGATAGWTAVAKGGPRTVVAGGQGNLLTAP